MILLRSLLFNATLYVWTFLCCIFLLWMLLLPRRGMIEVVKWYMRTLLWLERHLIGLTYEVRGREHLPSSGAFLVAAKHQSMWETMVLHLLVEDPAIILKRELLFVPIWGWYAAKAEMIAVKRGRRGKSVPSMLAGARRVAAEGRPIIIFPQGTRTAPGHYRPYKMGIGLLYEALNVPIVPLALNSGLYWPRRKFWRRPGTIIVEFLAPIPAGQPRDAVMIELEGRLEAASDQLSVAAGGPHTARPDPALAVA